MRVWRLYLRHGGWWLAASIAAGILGGLALAALMRLVHRAVTLPQGEALTNAVQFAGLLAVYFLGTVISEHALNDSSERMQWELRRSLVRQLFKMPLRTLERAGVPSLLTAVGTYVKVLSDYLCWLPNTVVNLAVVVGCFVYMAWLSPIVFALNVLFVGFAAACYLIPEGAAERLGRSAASAWDRHVGQVHYSLLGSRLLLLNRSKRSDFLTGHLEPTGAQVRVLYGRHRLVHLLAERFAEVMVLGNVACLLFILPRYMALSTATLTGLLLAALFVRAPLKSLLDVFPRTQGARIALERIHAVGLDAFADPPGDEPPAGPPPRFRELRLDNATFHYESDHGQPGFQVGPFSIRVHAGELLFVVGGNGAGKTTFAKLLCGLYPQSGGTVTVDGSPVETERDRELLRERFAAVFTDDPVFTHILGTPAGEAELRGSEILRSFWLAGKVSLNGAEFSTTDLSQGQRRRISLLCALLDERPILLLDEWAADQDPEFRAFFYQNLLPEFRATGKTIILITHDDRYFGLADRVIKLDMGRVVQEPAA